MSKQTAVLVTGGAGYIGSHVCKALAAEGYTPVVFDNFYTGHRDFIQWGPSIEGDVRDFDKLSQAMKTHKIESVIHFAGLTSVGESVQKPLDYYDVNLSGTRTLLTAMHRNGVKDLVFSSTAAVYGTPKVVPISESAPTAPENPYGRSKLASEMIAKDCAHAYDIAWIALRYFNASGASSDGDIGEDHTPETHLIPLALAAAANKHDPLTIFGNDWPTQDGTCIRDYIHVCDLADAHVKALQNLMKDKKSGPINLGIGKGYSVLEILNAIKSVTSLEVPMAMGSRRPGDVASLVADPSQAQASLGFKPQHSSLEHIIETAWKWFNKRILS